MFWVGDEEYVTFINQDPDETAVQSVKVRPVSGKHLDHIRLISFAQERLLALEHARVGRLQHVFLIRSRLKGSVDTDLLTQSLNDVIGRHEILRTSFRDRNGHASLTIVPELELNLSTVDLRAFSSVRQEEEMQRVTDTAALPLFDLEDGPLIRAILVRPEEEKFTLIVYLHQII